MKSVTITLDDELYDRAKMLAEQSSTSISELVGRWIALAPEPPAKHAGMSAEERELIQMIRQQHPGFSVKENLPREEVYRSHERLCLSNISP